MYESFCCPGASLPLRGNCTADDFYCCGVDHSEVCLALSRLNAMRSAKGGIPGWGKTEQPWYCGNPHVTGQSALAKVN